MSDGVHTSPAGNLLLAERMARAALGAFYGRPVDWQAPDIRRAVRSRDGKQIELTFQPVTSRIDTIDPTSSGFRVVDAQGVVPVAGTVYPLDNRVVLTVARPLEGNAVVHGGYGRYPDPVPFDMERFMPILAFHGVPVA
jgi:hypothetical protein